jgi:hypothetical protein
MSTCEREPLFQSSYGIPNDSRGYRGAPDVSYNASPAAGFSVCESVPYSGVSGWFRVGGTSAGSPQWAALIAIANSMRVANRKAPLAGTSGALCTAGAGYDYITGIGTPVGGFARQHIGCAVARRFARSDDFSRIVTLCRARRTKFKSSFAVWTPIKEFEVAESAWFTRSLNRRDCLLKIAGTACRTPGSRQVPFVPEHSRRSTPEAAETRYCSH